MTTVEEKLAYAIATLNAIDNIDYLSNAKEIASKALDRLNE